MWDLCTNKAHLGLRMSTVKKIPCIAIFRLSWEKLQHYLQQFYRWNLTFSWFGTLQRWWWHRVINSTHSTKGLEDGKNINKSSFRYYRRKWLNFDCCFKNSSDLRVTCIFVKSKNFFITNSSFTVCESFPNGNVSLYNSKSQIILLSPSDLLVSHMNRTSEEEVSNFH